MMHDKRRWGLTVEELATMLARRTQTLCAAFSVKGHEEYLFLNDATHEDGALEIAVVKRLLDGTYRQVESITFGWCGESRARGYIEEALAGRMDDSSFAQVVAPRIDRPSEHKDCTLCS
jgi:hypothetical protein